jgi:hypothetical protein
MDTDPGADTTREDWDEPSVLEAELLANVPPHHGT